LKKDLKVGENTFDEEDSSSSLSEDMDIDYNDI
jgi:hypothetical protein